MTIGNETSHDFDNFSNFSTSSTLCENNDLQSSNPHGTTDTTEHGSPDRSRFNKAFDILKGKRFSRFMCATENASSSSKDDALDTMLNSREKDLSSDENADALLSHHLSTDVSTQLGASRSGSPTINEDLNQDLESQEHIANSKNIPRGKLSDKLKGSKSGSKANQNPSPGTAQNDNQPSLSKSGPSTKPAGSGEQISGSDAETPLWHTIMTKFGTTIPEFETFIKELDGGQGPKVVYPSVTFQGYSLYLKRSQVADIERHPIVFLVMNDEWRDDHGKEYYKAIPQINPRVNETSNLDPNSKGEGSKAKRSPADRPPLPDKIFTKEIFDYWFQEKSPDHLGLISQGPERIAEIALAKENEKGKEREDGSNIRQYMLSPKAGEGVTIYVIDSGLDPGHPDFARSYDPNEFFIATHKQTGPHPEKYAGKPYIPESETVMMDKIGHGHCMASLAGGAVYGVSKKARVVPVKYKYQLGSVKHSAIMAAFGYIMDKVQTNSRHSKLGSAVINLSGGYSREVLTDEKEFEKRKELLNGLLKECWRLDIVTVIAAGNDGDFQSRDLKDTIPACLGTPDNALITVGAATKDGQRHHLTTREVKEGAGSITVWAKGDMPTYCAAMQGTGSQKLEGTSLAAAQVSGLAAYFLSLSREELPVPKGTTMDPTSAMYQFGPDLHVKGTVARTVKEYIKNMSHVHSGGGVNMAYNGAEDEVCKPVRADAIPMKRATAPKKNAYGLTPFIVSGKLVGTGPNLSFCSAHSSPASRNSKTASKTKTASSQPTSRSRAATHAVAKSSGKPLKSTPKARQARATDVYRQIKQDK